MKLKRSMKKLVHLWKHKIIQLINWNKSNSLKDSPTTVNNMKVDKNLTKINIINNQIKEYKK